MGYNKNLIQNQNVFQPTARNLLGISSTNIKLSNEFMSQAYRRNNRTQQFKVAVNSFN